jgi:hypothetical protein
MIDRCANSPVVGIISSHSSSSFFAAAATKQYFPMMMLPGRRNTTTNYGMEAVAPTALMPTMMLIDTLSEGYHQSPGTKP